jgi:hypothetical protein
MSEPEPWRSRARCGPVSRTSPPGESVPPGRQSDRELAARAPGPPTQVSSRLPPVDPHGLPGPSLGELDAAAAAGLWALLAKLRGGDVTHRGQLIRLNARLPVEFASQLLSVADGGPAPATATTTPAWPTSSPTPTPSSSATPSATPSKPSTGSTLTMASPPTNEAPTAAKRSATGKPPSPSGPGWPSTTAARTTPTRSSGGPARTTAWRRPSRPPVPNRPGPAGVRSGWVPNANHHPGQHQPAIPSIQDQELGSLPQVPFGIKAGPAPGSDTTATGNRPHPA